MHKNVARIAAINVLLAFAFGWLLLQETPLRTSLDTVIFGVALVTNGWFLFRSMPSKHRKASRGSTPSRVASDADPIERRTPQEPQLTGDVEQPSQDGSDLPPWIRVNGSIVMSWNGHHHVAPTHGRDPLEVASNLHARLLAETPGIERLSFAREDEKLH